MAIAEKSRTESAFAHGKIVKLNGECSIAMFDYGRYINMAMAMDQYLLIPFLGG